MADQENNPCWPDAKVCLAAGAAGPAVSPTTETRPLPAALVEKEQSRKSPAEWAYERILLYIQNFEETLDDDHEIGMGFVAGGGGAMRIQGVGYFAPDLVTFYGVDDIGARTQIVQHVSQLNVMLKAAVKLHDEPVRIGFNLHDGKDGKG